MRSWPRELVEQRKAEEKAKANAPVTKVTLEDLFSQIQAGEMKNLNHHRQGRRAGLGGGGEGSRWRSSATTRCVSVSSTAVWAPSTSPM